MLSYNKLKKKYKSKMEKKYQLQNKIDKNMLIYILNGMLINRLSFSLTHFIKDFIKLCMEMPLKLFFKKKNK